MPDWAIAFCIIYYLVAVIVFMILLCGIDRDEPLVIKYGMYRGVTLEVVVRLFIAVFWLPHALFYWIRGLIRGD